MAQKPLLLTLKLDLDTLVEFRVAAKIFRERSASSFLHHYVVAKINEAKSMVSPDEFTRLVAELKDETLARSELRQRVAKRSHTRGIPGAAVELTKAEKRRKTG